MRSHTTVIETPAHTTRVFTSTHKQAGSIPARCRACGRVPTDTNVGFALKQRPAQLFDGMQGAVDPAEEHTSPPKPAHCTTFEHAPHAQRSLFPSVEAWRVEHRHENTLAGSTATALRAALSLFTAALWAARASIDWHLHGVSTLCLPLARVADCKRRAHQAHAVLTHHDSAKVHVPGQSPRSHSIALPRTVTPAGRRIASPQTGDHHLWATCLQGQVITWRR